MTQSNVFPFGSTQGVQQTQQSTVETAQGRKVAMQMPGYTPPTQAEQNQQTAAYMQQPQFGQQQQEVEAFAQRLVQSQVQQPQGRPFQVNPQNLQQAQSLANQMGQGQAFQQPAQPVQPVAEGPVDPVVGFPLRHFRAVALYQGNVMLLDQAPASWALANILQYQGKPHTENGAFCALKHVPVKARHLDPLSTIEEYRELATPAELKDPQNVAYVPMQEREYSPVENPAVEAAAVIGLGKEYDLNGVQSQFIQLQFQSASVSSSEFQDRRNQSRAWLPDVVAGMYPQNSEVAYIKLYAEDMDLTAAKVGAARETAKVVNSLFQRSTVNANGIYMLLSQQAVIETGADVEALSKRVAAGDPSVGRQYVLQRGAPSWDSLYLKSSMTEDERDVAQQGYMEKLNLLSHPGYYSLQALIQFLMNYSVKQVPMEDGTIVPDVLTYRVINKLTLIQ